MPRSAEIEDGAFIGPAAVLTNDIYPRSVDQKGALKDSQGWESLGVRVREGASGSRPLAAVHREHESNAVRKVLERQGCAAPPG